MLKEVVCLLLFVCVIGQQQAWADQDLDFYLDGSVAAMAGRLPLQIDPRNRIESVTRDGDVLVYYYTSERIPESALKKHAGVLRENTCTDSHLFKILSLGGGVRYRYQMKDTGEELEYETRLDDCGPNEFVL